MAEKVLPQALQINILYPLEVLFEEISLHYWGISPVNIENKKYLCWQGQHCRAGKKSKHWLCRKKWTDSAAESIRHVHPFSPAAPQASGPAAPHTFTPRQQRTIVPRTHQNGKVATSAPTKYPPRTPGPPHSCQHMVCGALITSTVTNAQSRDLPWQGSEGVGLPWSCFLFVFRTICTAQLVLECVFLAVAGEVPLQLSRASQTQLARGRAFQNVLCSNRKAAECYSSQKSAALVLF